ncbi:MAG: NHL repeat-containing protein, partial [Acidobacteria bacterium]|nr:NHL repeat-containing protein [Acidobacteriota bacterium]
MIRLVLLLPLAAALACGQDYQPLLSWGERGDGPGQLRGAHGITIDRGDEVIVIDSRNSHIYRFTAEGKLLHEIGSGPGNQDGKFAMPRDAAVNAAGEIYVADGSNNRIQVFSREGGFLRAFGSKGSGPGQFLRAHALDFDRKGRLFIADVDNSRIAVYDSKDRFVTCWGKA